MLKNLPCPICNSILMDDGSEYNSDPLKVIETNFGMEQLLDEAFALVCENNHRFFIAKGTIDAEVEKQKKEEASEETDNEASAKKEDSPELNELEKGYAEEVIKGFMKRY